MILTLLLAAASPMQADDATKRDEAYCAASDSGQPERFCLADRRYMRGESELADLLPQVHRATKDSRREIADFTKRIGGVSLRGDPVAALEKAQKAWEASYAADCGVVGLQVATGNGGTEGPTAQLECSADRIAERIGFLKTIYDLRD